MMLVNHRVVVTREQAVMLALEAEPCPSGDWIHDQTLSMAMMTGLPVLVADDWPARPVDCGDGWLAIANENTIYAWNDAQIKANLERAVRESSMASFDRHTGPSLGLYQQQPYRWAGLDS